MICPKCQVELYWDSDFMYDEYGIPNEGIVSNYHCINCKTEVTTYEDID